QYIAASRKMAIAAQRRLLGFAVVGLVVAIVLALLAATASYQARIAEAAAEASFERSEALRIASDADGLALAGESNAELASLLAIRSLNSTYSPQGDAALLRAIPQLYSYQLFSGNPDYIRDAAYAPDGSAILTGCQDGVLRQFDVSTGKLTQQLAG